MIKISYYNYFIIINVQIIDIPCYRVQNDRLKINTYTINEKSL